MPGRILKRKAYLPQPAVKPTLAERREKAFSSIRAHDHLFAQVIPASTDILQAPLPAEATSSRKQTGRSRQSLYEAGVGPQGTYRQQAYGQGTYWQGTYGKGAYEQELPHSTPIYQPRDDTPRSHTRQFASVGETGSYDGSLVRFEGADTRLAEPRDSGLVQSPQRRPRRRPVDRKRTTKPSLAAITYHATESVLGDDSYISGSSAKRQRREDWFQRSRQPGFHMPSGGLKEYDDVDSNGHIKNCNGGRSESQKPRQFSASHMAHASEIPVSQTSTGIKTGGSEVYDEAKAREMEEKLTKVLKRVVHPSFEDPDFDDPYKDEDFNDDLDVYQPRLSGSLKPRASEFSKPQPSTGRKRGRGETEEEVKARETEEKITKILQRAGLPDFEGCPSEEDYYRLINPFRYY